MLVRKLSLLRYGLPLALGATLLAGCGSDSDPAATSTNPPPATSTPDTIRQTQQGKVAGSQEDYGYAFKGIPYAAPPVGELRFAAPQPAASWAESEPLEATTFGSGCPQVASSFGAASDDENCLFLNVYTPTGGEADAENLPVMVWVHGGAFIAGSGGDSYHPGRLLEQGVVVVTLNYRLGVLGFLPAEGLPPGNGHFGIMDQQLALQWVQDNIGNFGGDPGNVTLFGESAGGASVLSHLVSAGAGTGSDGLFHKAIIQSGAYQPSWISQDAGAVVIGQPVVDALACEATDDIPACLRAASVEEILTAQGDSWFVPAWGDGLLPHSAYTALNNGGFPDGIPIMTGSNLHEGRLFVALEEIPTILAGAPNPVDTQAEYDAAVTTLLAADPRGLDAQQIADDFLAMQNPQDGTRFSLALAAIQTSWRFGCNQLDQVTRLSDQGVVTYGYWFTDDNAPSLFGNLPISFDLGASHAFEIQYLLNSDATMTERGANAAQLALSAQMIEYWTQFAKYGDPSSSDGTATWLDFANGETVMELNPATLGSDAMVDLATVGQAYQCDYWANPPLQPE